MKGFGPAPADFRIIAEILRDLDRALEVFKIKSSPREIAGYCGGLQRRDA
jgi:hypothetical protein